MFKGNALVILFCFLFFSCINNQEHNKDYSINVHLLSDNESLNPYVYNGANSFYMQLQVFSQLIGVDFKTLSYVPVLAKSLPTITDLDSGKQLFTMEIREDAFWDNGSSITANDVIFSLKAIKNPLVDAHKLKVAYEFVDSVILYPENPKKFSILSSAYYMGAAHYCGALVVLPEYFYDKEKHMRSISFHALNNNLELLKANQSIIAFATKFMMPLHASDSAGVCGSGPYYLSTFEKGKRIALKRKINWWGTKFTNENSYFETNPSSINYLLIKDPAASLLALKAGNLSVMRSVLPKDFADLKNEKNNRFKLYMPYRSAYTFIGLNASRVALTSEKTRQALAHLINYDLLIENVMYGFAERTVGFIAPFDTLNYANNIPPYEFNPEKALQLLKEDEWKDKNGDGVLEKTINGKNIKLELRFLINAGNEARKSIALLFQDAAKKIGVQVTIQTLEVAAMDELLKKKDFDISIGEWVVNPKLIDPKQVYHTTSINGGSNYYGFGNAYSDSLIDAIRKEKDEKARSVYYKKLQEALHQSAVYLYLWIPKERIAIQNKYDSIYTSVLSPGFWVGSFKE